LEQGEELRMKKQVAGTPPLRSFPPIVAADARVLILGSMPSVASLAKQEYYGHPRNAFWPIMGKLFDAGLDLHYEERQAVLREAGVAVWDVLKCCRRDGSLDSAIDCVSEVPNELATFLSEHRQIGTIFFNGAKAKTAFRRHVLSGLMAGDRNFRFVRLPSTSPAHAGRTFADKLLAWRAVQLAACSIE